VNCAEVFWASRADGSLKHMDHLIDDVARVLASPMSRRSALQQTARIMFGAAFGLTAVRAVAAQAPYNCGDNPRFGNAVGNCNAACNGPGNEPNVTGDCPAGCPTKSVATGTGGTSCDGAPVRTCVEPCPPGGAACTRAIVSCRCGTSTCGTNQCCCVQTLTCVTSANANGAACVPGSTAGCAA
jgi:hypothetical protein